MERHQDHWNYDAPLSFGGERGTVGGWSNRLGNFRDEPTAIRILGEELVLFRNLSGRPALIGRSCPHRGTSFEFGRVQERGIACCYHGWHFDIDGTFLDMPANP